MGAFWAYPAPLALLGPDGRAKLSNARFLKRFGPAGLAPEIRAELAADPSGRWHSVPGDSGRRADRVRALATPHGVLLIGDDVAEDQLPTLQALQARVSELEALVTTDHLTGAYNRVHFDAVLASELARRVETHEHLSLILLDIDRFKRINDTHGHATGDLVLKELVALVQSQTRSSDLLFRWGGEEFVVLLASAGHRRAATVAEGLRHTIAEHNFEIVGRVTVSLGVAEHDGDEPAAAWFQRLDAALYEAKRTGRNRVVVDPKGDSDRSAGGAGALNLVWHEGFESGDPGIDADHREIFRLANALIHTASEPGVTPERLYAALDAVIEHVKSHFHVEEAVLERLGYADLAGHRRSHAGLLKRALTLRARVVSGEATLGALVEYLALDVVVRHLTAADRAFFPLLAAARR